MSQIILDISANTFKNDINYAKKMIDEVYKIDTKKHEIIFKTQLFEKAGENIVLDHDVFDKLYKYCDSYGYMLTSSVFDLPSLKFLLKYSVPFIKIANNRRLDWLIGEIPRRIPVYMSVGSLKEDSMIRECKCDGNVDFVYNCETLYCVSDYENASMKNYEETFEEWLNKKPLNISDHTTNWDLFNKYKPEIYECHYKLEDSTGLDAGEFARTPIQLSCIL